MFKKSILASILLSTCLMASAANAGFVTTDWNNSGDNLALLNQDTGLEWLDFTQTKGYSMDSIALEMNTTFKGWRLPTNQEVTVFMGTYFAGYNYMGNSTTYRASSGSYKLYNFNRTLGNSSSSYNSTTGKYYDENNDIRQAGTYVNDGSYSILRGMSYSLGHNSESTNDSVFLVSDGGLTLSSINNPGLNINNVNAPVNSVPLPASLGLLGLGLLGFASSRKRKNK